MQTDLTLSIPYYNAANTLPLQLACWGSYSDEIKKNLKIVLVDDCSNESNKLANIFKKVPDLNIELYEVLEDIPWNDGGASNLSIFVANTEWILRTDMDYLIPAATMEYVMKNTFKRNTYYTFSNRYYHNKHTIGAHPSTLLMTKKIFVDAGAYDEDFTGNHGYTDSCLRYRLDKIAKCQHLTNVWIEGIFHGSKHRLVRNDTINHKLLTQKIKEGFPKPASHLRFKWRKIEL